LDQQRRLLLTVVYDLVKVVSRTGFEPVTH
jgi:hypothetical protein